MAHKTETSFPPYRKNELATAFSNSPPEHQFPAFLTAEQAAALLQVPTSTINEWSRTGRLSGCCRHVGKHLRIFRDRLLTKAFEEGF